MKRNKLWIWFVIMAVLLGGCGSSSKGVEEMAQNMSKDTAAISLANTGEKAEVTGDGEVAPEDSEAAETGASGDEQAKLSEKDLASRKLIKTVSLSLETKAFDELKGELEEQVVSYGGYVEHSSFDDPQGGEGYRYYSITARIPSDQLDSFTEKAGELGQVTNKSENVEDVTLDYVDKTAYKESLQVEYDRVMELLEEAKDLDQILALESKLSQLRYEIDSYESQLRTYDNLIDYSTVHIYISEVEYEQEKNDIIGNRISNGFRSSLYGVRDFFVNLFVWLVSNLPVLLLLGGVAAVAVFFMKKLLKRRKTGKNKKELKEEKELVQEKKEEEK